MGRLGTGLGIALLVAAGAANAQAADTYTAAPATTDAASTACTPAGAAMFSCANLRSAVAAADADPGSTVQLSTGTYTLTTGHVTVAPTGALTITGTGAGQTIIKQTNATSRVLNVQSGTVELSQLEITGGHATTSGSCGTGVSGGGIVNAAALTLDHVTVTANDADGREGATAPSGTAGSGDDANGGGICSTGALTVIDSTITANTAQGGKGGTGTGSADGGVGGNASGGGIDSLAALIVRGTAVSSNHAIGGGGGPATGSGDGGVSGNAEGGGIEGAASTAPMITADMFSADTVAAGTGGAASAGNGARGGYAFGSAFDGYPATISDSQFSGGIATGGTGGAGEGAGNTSGEGGFVYGAAIDSQSAGTLTISGSSVTGNTGTAGDAGAVSGGASRGAGGNTLGGALEPSSSTLLLTSSTLSGNRAVGGSPDGNGYGGAMDVRAGVIIVNATLAGNHVRSGSSGSARGGGILLETTGSQRLTLASVTLAGNTADASGGTSADGGNIDTGFAATPTMTVEDTIIAGGTVTTVGTIPSNCDGPVSTDGGHNLESTTASQCGFGSAKADLIGTDPLLAPLAANGSTNDTLALGAQSPAIGTGGACTDPSNIGHPLTVDERGAPRGTVCDIGAFQAQAPVLTTSPAVSGTAKIGNTLTCSSGQVTGDQPLTSVFQWLRNGAVIGGATTSQYTVASGDALASIGCGETVTNIYGSAQAVSSAVSIPPPKPQVGRVKQAHRTWRTGSRSATISRRHRRPPVGTTFTFSLNTSANLTLTFTHTRPGRKSGRNCVAIAKRNLRHGKKCTRTITDGTITFKNAGAGTVKVGFQGRISRNKKLGKGRYKLAITASNSSGRGSSSPIMFTIAS